MIAIGHWGSCGNLSSRLIQTKNRSVYENAVTGILGSWRLLVMGSWFIPTLNLFPIQYSINVGKTTVKLIAKKKCNGKIYCSSRNCTLVLELCHQLCSATWKSDDRLQTPAINFHTPLFRLYRRVFEPADTLRYDCIILSYLFFGYRDHVLQLYRGQRDFMQNVCLSPASFVVSNT